MELVIKTEKLMEPLSTVVGVTESKQTMPILSHLYFRVKNSQMTLIGTDTEVEVTARISLEKESPDMEGTLPARKFLNICRSYAEEDNISLRYEKERMVVFAGRSKFELASYSTADFPLLQVPDEEEKKIRFSLSQNKLRKKLREVISCMAVQDVRYFLNGALFDFSPDGLHIVATDGHKLAVTEESAPQLTAEKIKCIVPRKGVTELLRLLNSSEEPVDLVFYPHFVQVVTPEFSYGCKLIDATFPDYARVVPVESEHSFLVDTDAFIHSLRRCAILASDKIQKVILSFQNDFLALSASNRNNERIEEELPIEKEGEGISISFNTYYLIDILGTMEGGKVKLSVKNGNSSALLQKHGDDATLFVVMPMKS